MSKKNCQCEDKKDKNYGEEFYTLYFKGQVQLDGVTQAELYDFINTNMQIVCTRELKLIVDYDYDCNY